MLFRGKNIRRVDDFGNFLGPEADDGELKEDFDNTVYILNKNAQVIFGPFFTFCYKFDRKKYYIIISVVVYKSLHKNFVTMVFPTAVKRLWQ